MLPVLDRIVAAVSAAAVAATVIITCLAVFCRYVLDSALPWPEEIDGYLLIWISFLGAYLAAREGQHLGIDMLMDRLPEGGRRALRSAVDLALVLLFALVLVYSLRWIRVSGGREIETAEIPKGIFMSVIPLAMALLIVALAADMLRRRKGP
jgi:TRAP-type C4-dicarboxylate transport system permease small subunit